MKRLLAAIFLLASLAAAPAAETSSELKPFVRGSWQEMLRAHTGRPTLVHFWGVTCGPCKIELPLLGQFMKDHPELDVVMISADLVPNLPDAARAMLEKAGLGTAENWLFSDGFVERLRFEIDPAWQGGIPAHDADRAGRNGNHNRRLGRNVGPRKMAGSAKDRGEMRNADSDGAATRTFWGQLCDGELETFIPIVSCSRSWCNCWRRSGPFALSRMRFPIRCPWRQFAPA